MIGYCITCGEGNPCVHNNSLRVERVDVLAAERALARICETSATECAALQAKLAAAEASLKRLVEALRFYAAQSKWLEGGYESNGPVGWVTEPSDAEKDSGAVAREALAAEAVDRTGQGSDDTRRGTEAVDLNRRMAAAQRPETEAASPTEPKP